MTSRTTHEPIANSGRHRLPKKTVQEVNLLNYLKNNVSINFENQLFTYFAGKMLKLVLGVML